MTIETIYYVGQTIAAIAVIVSVLYLAAQVKQNTEAVGRGTFEAAIGRVTEHVCSEIASSDASAGIYYQGLEDFDELSPVEQLRLRYLMMKLLLSYEPTIDTHRRSPGLIKPSVIDVVNHTIRQHLSTSGGSRWWNLDGKQWFAADYRDYIDQLLR